MWLSGRKSLPGVKVNVAPLGCHDPGVAGTSVGGGEPFARGAEKLTTIGESAATPAAPLAGVTETTVSAAGGALVVDEVVLEAVPVVPD
jgi:hypothetical protein